MSLGPGGKLNILQQSPHDFQPSGCGARESQEQEAGAVQWLPSRYNIRAAADDGRLIVWNTYSGSMSVFTAEQRPAIEVFLNKQGFGARPEGIVKYLHERGFLLKEGTDEYRRIQFSFGHQQHRQDTLQLCLLASEDCNFRCIYCYEKFARGTMQPDVRDNIKKLVKSRLEGLRNFSVSWFGGEPLYGFPAIEDLAPFFAEIAEENSLRFTSDMTTNGYLLSPEIASKLLAWKISAFQITLDGPPEEHDRCRPTRDGRGTFATIFENLKSLRSRDDEFVVDIRVNWDKKNYPKLEGFMDLAEKEFSQDPRFRVRFHSIFDGGGPESGQLEICGLDESVKLQAELEKEARRRGLDIGDNLRGAQPFGSKVCYAARPYHFVIGATGKVMKCTVELDTADRNVVGRLTDEGELVLDQDKLALWCEPAFEKDTKCQKCVVLPMCLGSSCPLIRYETKKSPCIPLRRNAKKDLRGILQMNDEKSRKVTLTGYESSQASRSAALSVEGH